MLEAIVFADDPNEEHEKILSAKDKAEAHEWETGARLLHLKETGAWSRVTSPQAPFTSFTDYVVRGTRLPKRVAFSYMKAAELPRKAVEQLGIAGAELLASLVELTQAEETLQDALNLEVESDDGTLQRFADLSIEQKRRALARVRLQSGVVKGGKPPRADTEGTRLRDRLRELLKGHLKPGQIQTRRIGGNDVIDLNGIPIDRARELFELIAKGLRH